MAAPGELAEDWGHMSGGPELVRQLEALGMSPGIIQAGLEAVSSLFGGGQAPGLDRMLKWCVRNEEPHRLLGVKQSATDAEVVKAYRRAALAWHPDRCSQPGWQAEHPGWTAEWAEERFKALRAAQDKMLAMARIRFNPRVLTQASPLHEAAKVGDCRRVASLAEQRPEWLYAVDALGLDPLGWAARNGHDQAVGLLLELRAKMAPTAEQQNQLAPSTANPLIQAAGRGRTGAMRKLIESGADIHAKEAILGHSSLMTAANRGQLQAVEMLLSRKAEVDARDGKGYSPLCVASFCGHVPVVVALLAAGADANILVEDEHVGKSYTPLALAARKSREQIVGLLLDAGAKVDSEAWRYAEEREDKPMLELMQRFARSTSNGRRKLPSPR